MSKIAANFVLQANDCLTSDFSLMKLKLCGVLEAKTNRFATEGNIRINVSPGQFVEVQVPDSPTTFLRRPISVYDWDVDSAVLTLLVRAAGDGTRALCELKSGAMLNIVFPLGNGFGLADCGDSPLLIGGGVGVAPLYYAGKVLKQNGIKPSFLLAARSKELLLCINEFSRFGDVFISTDDGSAGEKGLITANSNLLGRKWSKWMVCGPMPMMKAVAEVAAGRDVECEVSLENMMACGVGACLCCVENTREGHKCVCTEGPVFNIKDLLW